MTDKVTAVDREIKALESVETGDVTPSTLDLPSLDQVMQQICRDARHDSMRFAMRSDVGLDGE